MDSFKLIVEKCLSFSNDDPLLNLIMGICTVRIKIIKWPTKLQEINRIVICQR